MTLEALFAASPVDVEEMKGRVKRAAEELGLPMGNREKTYNSRLCQELGKWAETKNRGHEFHMAAFRAYFVDGKNIAVPEVLVDLAASVTLPAEEALGVLEKRLFREAVDLDWALSRQKGVTAVPSFIAGNESLVGAQPYGMLERLVRGNGAGKRGGAELKNPGFPGLPG